MGSILNLVFSLALAHADGGYAQLGGTFTKTQATVGKQKIEIFVADTDPRRMRGLMGVERLPENTGMIFVFDRETPQSFWMKDTIIDLSIGFFSAAGELIDVQEMTATSVMDKNPPSYHSHGNALYALEMNKDWFTKHNVAKGARLAIVGKPASALLNKQIAKGKQAGQ